MIDQKSRPTRDPYLLDEQPTSSGRIFLPRAFEHYIALHHGYSGEEIAAAFRGEEQAAVRGFVRMSARLIGEALARSCMRSWARPFGGGEPVELRPGAWELDNFDRRFATGAVDPQAPFDDAAEPTHWIFVEMDGWNALVEASVADVRPPPRARHLTLRLGPGAPVEEAAAAPIGPRDAGDYDPNRLVRLDEVKRRTGLSRSSIYRRMSERRFPQQVPMSGSNASWRERDLAEWLAYPT